MLEWPPSEDADGRTRSGGPWRPARRRQRGRAVPRQRRTRRLRRRLRRPHQGPPLARHRAPGARPAHQPRAPRRHGLRPRHRRRRRHPHPDARRVPARASSPFDLPPAGRLRRRPGVPADRRRRARAQLRALVERIVARGRPDRARLAAGADPPRRRRRAAPPRSRRSSSSSSWAAARRRPTPTPARASSARCTSSASASSTPSKRSTSRPRRARAFYVVSLSAHTLIYKGMLTATQIERMFPDLPDPVVESALALVHQRFSTNTFPSWPLAHPYRYRGAQRRDQHPARQHQLDAGPRRAAAVARVRRRPGQAAAGHPPRRQRHRHLRQRARVPGHGRAARCRTPC